NDEGLGGGTGVVRERARNRLVSGQCHRHSFCEAGVYRTLGQVSFLCCSLLAPLFFPVAPQGSTVMLPLAPLARRCTTSGGWRRGICMDESRGRWASANGFHDEAFDPFEPGRRPNNDSVAKWEDTAPSNPAVLGALPLMIPAPPLCMHV